jgi:branched-chain amino acid transport system ATP-binding protein
VSDPLLSVQGLSVSYGRVQAVRDVSFEAASGAWSRWSGPTAPEDLRPQRRLRAAEAAQGTVVFDGTDVTRWSAHRLVDAGLVQVPEGRRCWPA